MNEQFKIRWVISCDYYTTDVDGKGIMAGVYSEGIAIADGEQKAVSPFVIVFCIHPLMTEIHTVFQLRATDGGTIATMRGSLKSVEEVKNHDRVLVPMPLPGIKIGEFGPLNVYAGTSDETLELVHQIDIVAMEQ